VVVLDGNIPLFVEVASDAVGLGLMVPDGVASVVECVVTVVPLDVTPVDSELLLEAGSVEGVLLEDVWLSVVKDCETILLSSVELPEDGAVFDPMALEVVLEFRLPGHRR
jgi:hypothetical protein